MATSLQDVLKAAKKKVAETSGRKERPMKPTPGKSTWRILPGWRADEPNMFYHAYGQHFVKDIEGTLVAIVGCPERTFDGDCEICNAVAAGVKSAPNDDIRNAINESRAQQQYLVNAIQPDVDPKKVVILAMGGLLFDSYLQAASEYDDLLDAEVGQDVIIDRSGTGLNTKYSMTVRPASKSKPVDKSVLMTMHNLDEFVQLDGESKKQKALEAIQVATGMIPGGATAALAGPKTDAVLEVELDDEIPDFDKKVEVEDAEVVEEKKAAEADFGADISDDDLDDMLADL